MSPDPRDGFCICNSGEKGTIKDISLTNLCPTDISPIGSDIPGCRTDLKSLPSHRGGCPNQLSNDEIPAFATCLDGVCVETRQKIMPSPCPDRVQVRVEFIEHLFQQTNLVGCPFFTTEGVGFCSNDACH